MPSPNRSNRSEPLRAFPRLARVPAAVLIGLAMALAAATVLGQEQPRNIIRWRNEGGAMMQIDVGPSLPRNATKSTHEKAEEKGTEETLRAGQRHRLEAERDKLELQKEIAELEKEIAEIDNQIAELRSRQDHLKEYDKHKDDSDYYLGWNIRRRADKRLLLRRYKDRLYHYRRPPQPPEPQPKHRVQKKLQ